MDVTETGADRQMKPELPPKPELREPPPGSWLSILLALAIGSIILAALSLVTLYYLLPVFAVAALIFLVAAFHYLVWGRWMQRLLNQSSDENEESTLGK